MRRKKVSSARKGVSWRKPLHRVESTIRGLIPARELHGIIDNIGLPNSGINLSYNDSGVAGPADGDIMVSLQSGHRPTADYVRNLRLALNRDFPGVTFYFLPADIVSQTISFGLPAPFDIQVLGRDQSATGHECDQGVSHGDFPLRMKDYFDCFTDNRQYERPSAHGVPSNLSAGYCPGYSEIGRAYFKRGRLDIAPPGGSRPNPARPSVQLGPGAGGDAAVDTAVRAASAG